MKIWNIFGYNLRNFNIETCQIQHIKGQFFSNINTMVIDMDNKNLLCGLSDGTIKIWNIEDMVFNNFLVDCRFSKDCPSLVTRAPLPTMNP